MKNIYIILVVLFYIIALLLLYNGVNSDLSFSIIYVIFSLTTIATIWHYSSNSINMFILFIVAFNLFLGGRFYVCLFDNTISPFQATLFYDYYVPIERKLETFLYVISFLCFSTIGFYLSKVRPYKMIFEIKVSNYSALKFDDLLKHVFPFLAVVIIYLSYTDFLDILAKGYAFTALAVDKTAVSTSYFDKFVSLALMFLLGMSVAYGSKKTMLKYVLVYGIRGFFSILGGSRADFGAVILIIIWIYSLNRKVSFKKIILLSAVGLVSLLLLFSLSVREAGNSSFSFIGAINMFLYTQGVSLMVFDASRLITGYPILPYFQTFIPGASFIYSIISGTVLYPQDISFQGHLCYSLNQDLFRDGLGLGWTTPSDLYLFSGRIFVIYCFLALILGRFLGTIEYWAKQSKFFQYVSFAMAQSLFMMPRGSLAAIFPLFFYIYLFFFISFIFISKNKIDNCSD